MISPRWQAGSRAFLLLQRPAIAAYVGVNDDGIKPVAGYRGWRKHIHQVASSGIFAGGSGGVLFSGRSASHVATAGCVRAADADGDVDVLHLPVWLLEADPDGTFFPGPGESLGSTGRILHLEPGCSRDLRILYSFPGLLPDHLATAPRAGGAAGV